MPRATEPANARVLVLDDEASVRQTLSAVLSTAGFGVICCADLHTLLALARAQTPSCILLDLVLPGISGLEALTQLREQDCLAPVLMISGKGDIPSAVAALKRGACDFIEKPFRGSDLIHRVKAAIAVPERRGSQPVASCIERSSPWTSLTARERDVLALVARGHSTKDTARRLNISPRTVEGYRVSIMRKLGASSPAELVRIVIAAGYCVTDAKA